MITLCKIFKHVSLKFFGERILGQVDPYCTEHTAESGPISLDTELA